MRRATFSPHRARLRSRAKLSNDLTPPILATSYLVTVLIDPHSPQSLACCTTASGLRPQSSMRSWRRVRLEAQPDRSSAQRRCKLSILTTDRFGRYVVMSWPGRLNLSCWQLQRGQAIYKPRWDYDGVVAWACRYRRFNDSVF
jgi:hypothetical protein